MVQKDIKKCFIERMKKVNGNNELKEFDKIKYETETTIDSEFYKHLFFIGVENLTKLQKIDEEIKKGIELVLKNDGSKIDFDSLIKKLDNIADEIIRKDLTKQDNFKFSEDFKISFKEYIEDIKNAIYIYCNRSSLC